MLETSTPSVPRSPPQADEVGTLSLTGRRWIVRGDLRSRIDAAPHLLASLIAKERGIDGEPGNIFDAFLLPDLRKAAERIEKAITDGEMIGIFGDYDCDGVTSVAQLQRFFERRNVRPVIRLPHRLKEGYGLRDTTVQEFETAGVGLLITADTGVSSFQEITTARNAGIDVIVIDHHHLPSALPPAYAILHPAVAACPEPHPAASGLTFSVITALEKLQGNETWNGRDTDLSLATLGTVADLVELRGGNRALVEQGIAAFCRITDGPLAALRLHAGIKGICRSTDIAFRIAPRVNAAGRMADPLIALQALLGDMQAMLLLEQLNQERQSSVLQTMDEVLAEAACAAMPFIAIAKDTITPGIAGLIAGKLTEKYGRPSLVASIQGDRCSASLRSIPGYNVTDALASAADLLTNYGGHAQAAGCTFPLTSFVALHERLCADLLEKMKPAQLLPTLGIDSPIDLAHITLTLCRSLAELEPYGQGNAEPRFTLANARLQDIRAVGKESAHLQARLPASAEATVGRPGIKMIGFGLGHLAEHIRTPVDIAFRLGVNEWMGKVSPQLFLDDVRARD